VDKLADLHRSGTEIVLVSASAENWLADWCTLHNITLVASVLEVTDGRITGKLAGANCHGEEKVKRIRKQFDLSAYQSISCYGDTSGDKPMLALATEAYYKPFREL
jgi:phosphatidylglycerophosphatase C